MNIIHNISNIKKTLIINYNKKYTAKNIKNHVDSKTNLIKNKKKIYNNQKNTIKNISTDIKTKNTMNLEDNLNEINNKIINNVKKNNNSQNLFDIFKLIGHNVLIPGSKVIYTKNKNIVYGYFLPKDTTSTLIQIKNKNNQLVFSHLVGPQKSGNYVHYWNGKIDNISTLNTGWYDISIKSENETGPVYIQPLVEGMVHSIDSSPNENQYTINLGPMGTVNILDIKQIL